MKLHALITLLKLQVQFVITVLLKLQVQSGFFLLWPMGILYQEKKILGIVSKHLDYFK